MDYSQVKNFLKFVQIDAEIDELESDKSLVLKEIAKAESLIEDCTSQISKNQLRLDGLKKKLHSFELELKVASSQESDKKNKLERISNNREFFAVNQELEDILKKKAKLESEYLICWQELELAEKEVTEANKNFESSIAHEVKEVLNFKRRLLSIENRLQDTITPKNEAIKSVDPELLSQYTSMKQSSTNPVVKVKRDSCGGCFYELSRQDLLSIYQHKLIKCKNCYRIIYNPEEYIE